MVDVVAASAGERIETESDLGTGEAATYAYWMAQEEIAEKEERKWVKQAREIVKRYRDDDRGEQMSGLHRFNVLWSNVQTLKPTLYARTPKPDVDRRFKDQAPVARFAAQLLERCLSYSASAFDFDAVMKSVVEDRLLPGRGVARVLYVPHFGEEISDTKTQGETTPAAAEDEGEGEDQAAALAEEDADYTGREEEGSDIDNAGDDESGEEHAREVEYEEVVAQYVFWEDYREGPARQWAEVPWVRYRAYLTRDELIKRFGKRKGKLVNLDYAPAHSPEKDRDGKDVPPDLYKKAEVREYWDKGKREVIWIAPATPDIVLDKKDDPLRLPDFFANPDPLLATTTNDKRIPVPDYIEYQDQARELDHLTARIDKLTTALRVAGVYPGDEKTVLSQLMDPGTDNRLIPVGDWQNWADKGGLKTFIEWLPIQQIAETLLQLYNARDRVKAILYEITGIGDIMRGMTQPDETLGAQELKAVFSTRRITPQQKDVARLARDLLRLMGAVIAEHFSAKTISLITGFPQLAPVPQLPPKPAEPVQSILARIQAAQQQPQQAPQQTPGAPAMNGAPQPPGAPNSAGGSPQAPQPPPDPQVVAYQQALAKWQQMAQQVHAIEAANKQKQDQFDQAVQLIKDDGIHGFRIDIEADSTIAPDEQAEKKARTDFLSEFVPLMEQIVPMAQGNPALASLAKEVALFGVRGFPVARSLEETIEKAFDAIAQMPPHPSQQPQQGKGSAADSSQALAQRERETQGREQIEREKLAATQQRDATAQAIEREKAAVQAQTDRERLALDTQRGAKQDAMAAVRMTHLESGDAARLT
jgi:hypothetical protein